MKSHESRGQATIDGDDSAKAVLISLAADRGGILTEAEYREMRGTVLSELAMGPRLALSTLVTFGVVGVILLGFFMVGFFVWLHHPRTEWLLLASTLFCMGLWVYVLRKYLRGVRELSRLSVLERLTEVTELRDSKLISQEEFESIYASIHMNRGVPERPERPD